MKYLKPRQQQVLELVCEGISVEEIGQRIGLAHGTVKCHLARLFWIFGVQNRVQLVVAALQAGNVRIEDLPNMVTNDFSEDVKHEIKRLVDSIGAGR